MTFKPGQSGNPSGRPKKLLKRVDEVLHARGIEPIEEVLRLLDGLKKRKGTQPQRLKIWMELLPYVYARVKEQPEDPGESLHELSNAELVKRLEAMLPELKKEAKTELKKVAG